MECRAKSSMFMSCMSLLCTVWFCCLCPLPPLPQRLLLGCSDQPFYHPLYPCSHFPHPFTVPLSVRSSPLLSQHFSFIVLPSFCLSHRSPVPFYHIALTGKISSFHTCILPADPSPTSFHLSLSLSCVTPPSLPPSRDNYYKPCEDQLVFKQLNKQGLGLLTVAIQQQSSENLE